MFVTVMYCWSGLCVSIVIGLLVNELRCKLLTWRQERRAKDLIISYEIAPETSMEPEEFEDYFDMVDSANDRSWIEAGIDCAWIYAIDAEARRAWDQAA